MTGNDDSKLLGEFTYASLLETDEILSAWAIPPCRWASKRKIAFISSGHYRNRAGIPKKFSPMQFMKIKIKPLFSTYIIGAVTGIVGLLPVATHAATLASNGSPSDVAAKIASAVDGDVVTIPAGTFTWPSGVSISGKGITLAGNGSGRIIARSASNVTVNTGTISFATQAGLPITTGQTLRIERTGIITNFMQGTVASYSGTTLQMNITSCSGAGSYTGSPWIISTIPKTTIIHNAGSGALISIFEDATNTAAVAGIQFLWGTGTGDMVAMGSTMTTSTKLAQVYDCWFRSGPTSLNSIFTNTNRGVVYRCSFDSSPFSMAPLGIHLKGAPATSWTTPSTMGTADTTGTKNFYVEDCDFHAWLNATDIDDCGRAVFRKNLFNNAGFGTHGADTSNYGVRHYEIYDNEFVFNGKNDGTTFNLNWWFFLRGGTGVIADNILPDLTSGDYGNKAEINATVMNLQRSGGPNGCWGANILGTQYPAPRQVGMGYVTGAAGNDAITYKGDSEPLYIWGNSVQPAVGRSDYGGTACLLADLTVDYVVAGRDFIEDGTKKPGYTKYPYPHPLRVSAPPSNAVVAIQLF